DRGRPRTARRARHVARSRASVPDDPRGAPPLRRRGRLGPPLQRADAVRYATPVRVAETYADARWPNHGIATKVSSAVIASGVIAGGTGPKVIASCAATRPMARRQMRACVG